MRLSDDLDLRYLVRDYDAVDRYESAGGSLPIRSHLRRVRQTIAAVLHANADVPPRSPAALPVTGHLARALDEGSRDVLGGLCQSLRRVAGNLTWEYGYDRVPRAVSPDDTVTVRSWAPAGLWSPAIWSSHWCSSPPTPSILSTHTPTLKSPTSRCPARGQRTTPPCTRQALSSSTRPITNTALRPAEPSPASSPTPGSARSTDSATPLRSSRPRR